MQRQEKIRGVTGSRSPLAARASVSRSATRQSIGKRATCRRRISSFRAARENSLLTICIFGPHNRSISEGLSRWHQFSQVGNMNRAIDGKTLREKCRDANRVVREAIDHIENGFLPKVHALRKLARSREQSFDPSSVRDVTIRTHAAAVLEAEQYLAKLDEESKQLLTSIAVEVEHLVNTGTV